MRGISDARGQIFALGRDLLQHFQRRDCSRLRPAQGVAAGGNKPVRIQLRQARELLDCERGRRADPRTHRGDEQVLALCGFFLGRGEILVMLGKPANAVRGEPPVQRREHFVEQAVAVQQTFVYQRNKGFCPACPIILLDGGETDFLGAHEREERPNQFFPEFGVVPEKKIALKSGLAHQPNEVRIAVLYCVSLEQLAQANLDERVTSELVPPALFWLPWILDLVFWINREGPDRLVGIFQGHAGAPPSDAHQMVLFRHFFGKLLEVGHVASLGID